MVRHGMPSRIRRTMWDVHTERLPSGTWRVTVSHRGQRRRGTAPTKREAEVLGGRLLDEMGGGLDYRSTLGDLLRRHVDSHPYAETTSEDMHRVLARLPDDVLAWPLPTITTGRLVGLYERLAALPVDPWTPYRVVRCHELISSAFTRAVRLDVVARNPAKGAAPKRPAPPDIVPPTDDEMAALIDAAGNVLPAIMLAAAAGVRRGELVALQWRDVDFTERSLTVRRAAAYTRAAGVHIKELKNGEKGYRVIALDDETAVLLRGHRTAVLEERMSLGLPVPEDLFLFSNDLGEHPWRPDYATYRWGKIRGELGLERVRLYDVRHYMVTSMLQAGEPVATVAGRAGHNPVTMLRRYWHFVPASDRAEADRHAGRLAAARQRKASS